MGSEMCIRDSIIPEPVLGHDPEITPDPGHARRGPKLSEFRVWWRPASPMQAACGRQVLGDGRIQESPQRAPDLQEAYLSVPRNE